MKEKQKLDRRNTYTPTGAPQACGNCDPHQNGVLKSLNREETLSVPGLKTPSNNPDVGLPRSAGGLKADLLVFILNKGEKIWMQL